MNRQNIFDFDNSDHDQTLKRKTLEYLSIKLERPHLIDNIICEVYHLSVFRLDICHFWPVYLVREHNGAKNTFLLHFIVDSYSILRFCLDINHSFRYLLKFRYWQCLSKYLWFHYPNLRFLKRYTILMVELMFRVHAT